LTLVVVYVTLTVTGLSVVVFLLHQLDIIFSRRPASSLQPFFPCCWLWRSARSSPCSVDKVKEHAGRTLPLMPLIIYIGIINAFVSCEFTEVCIRALVMCATLISVSQSVNQLVSGS